MIARSTWEYFRAQDGGSAVESTGCGHDMAGARNRHHQVGFKPVLYDAKARLILHVMLKPRPTEI